MTARDPRYTVNQEYTGEPGPRYVARFCMVWISSHDTAEEARRACDLHYRARMTPAHTRPGAQRAQTAKRKMALCIKHAREVSRDSWQVYTKGSRNRAECRHIRRESIEDARYWRNELRAAQETTK